MASRDPPAEGSSSSSPSPMRCTSLRSLSRTLPDPPSIDLSHLISCLVFLFHCLLLLLTLLTYTRTNILCHTGCLSALCLLSSTTANASKVIKIPLEKRPNEELIAAHLQREQEATLSAQQRSLRSSSVVQGENEKIKDYANVRYRHCQLPTMCCVTLG